MIILLIEDNEKLAANVAAILQSEGYQVEIAPTVTAALVHCEEKKYDLIILDLSLPDGDGIDLCAQLRSHHNTTPLLMLTARLNIESKVEGLDSGADDYLTKPFLTEELLARVRALLRRESINRSEYVSIGDVIADLRSKIVTKAGQSVELSPIELKLLEVLLIKRGQVQNAEQLYQSVWGDTDGALLFSDTLKVTVARLRKKIGAALITTVPGFGYVIE
jgi:two-component system OmpR family response regulator